MNMQVRRGVLNATLAIAIPVIGISAATGVFAEQSEIDVFDQALASGSKEGAVRFLEAFPSSHLGSDLIELLPPEVAAAVCGGLPSGTGSATRHSCGQLSEAIALAPGAGASETRETAPQRPNAQPADASPTAKAVGANSGRSEDKPNWLTSSIADEPITADLEDSSRRGRPAKDKTKDVADSAPEDATADSTDTSNDTTAANPNQNRSWKSQEDGGAVVGGPPGGKGSDGGTGGNSGGGSADSGGRR